MKSIKYLLIIAFLSLSLVATLYLVGRTTIFQKRASSSSSYVLENSYLFASPLQAKASDKDLPADRREMIRLTVFLLDGRGLGVANQTITLHLPKDVTILSQQEITDNTGKRQPRAALALAAPVRRVKP